MTRDFVVLEGYDLVLGHRVLQPLEVLERLGARIVEQRIEVGVEHLPAAAVDLRDVGLIEVRQRLVVFVDDRLLHAGLLQLQAGIQHLVPVRRHRDLMVLENLPVVLESDQIGVVRQAIQLVVVGHVADRVVRHLVFVLVDLGKILLDRDQPAGQRPARQPVLAAIHDVGGRAAPETQHHRVEVVRPGVVGELDLEARTGGFELGDVVLDRLERIVPDDEIERGRVLGEDPCRQSAKRRPGARGCEQSASREPVLHHCLPVLAAAALV